ncbi:MAG: hypothetical protein U0457_06105 [Candidatus Sericytochromatia bacterium]
MRIANKIPFLCHSCNFWFYEYEKDFSPCPKCNKEIKKLVNTNDRHLEICNSCQSEIEVTRKSPYDNSHYLNCSDCITVLKISYSDNILQKYSNELGFYSKNINTNEINSYKNEMETHLNECLCGGEFGFSNSKKCPYCFSDIPEIKNNYLILDNKSKNNFIPIITKHIWKSSLSFLYDKNYLPEIEHKVFSFLKQIKFLQEKYYELTNSYAISLDNLINKIELESFLKIYKIKSNLNYLEPEFKMFFEIFEDDFIFKIEAVNKSNNYLIKGKTAIIERYNSN